MNNKAVAEAVSSQWLIDGNLIYKLSGGVNHDEIKVTMANGSNDPKVCNKAATQLLAAIRALPLDDLIQTEGDERAAFEAWAKSVADNKFPDLSRDGEGYWQTRTNTAWKAWQARSAKAAPQPSGDVVAGLVDALCGLLAYADATHRMQARMNGEEVDYETFPFARAALAKVQEQPNYEAISRYLYKLLDDIDTAGDAAKNDDARYRRTVELLQSKKSSVVAECDGYTVKFKTQEVKP